MSDLNCLKTEATLHVHYFLHNDTYVHVSVGWIAGSGNNLLQFTNWIQCMVSLGNVIRALFLQLSTVSGISDGVLRQIPLIWHSALKYTHKYLFINATNTNLSPTRTSWVGEQRLVPISDTMTPASPPIMLRLHSGTTVTGPSIGSNILWGQGSRDEVMMSPWMLAGG